MLRELQGQRAWQRAWGGTGWLVGLGELPLMAVTSVPTRVFSRRAAIFDVCNSVHSSCLVHCAFALI